MSNNKGAVMAVSDAWGKPAEIRIEKLHITDKFRFSALDSDSVAEGGDEFGSACEGRGHAALNLSVEEMKSLAMILLTIVRDYKADDPS